MKITRNQAANAFRGLTQNLKFENEVNSWAASRNIKKLKNIAEDIDVFTQTQRLNLCFKDKDKCPVKDEKGGMKFLEANEQKFNDTIQAHMKEEIDFEPYTFSMNKEMMEKRYFFINSDIEFLLNESLLSAPTEKEETQS